jgi:hypothetical protein
MYLKIVVGQLNLFHRTVLEKATLSATAVVCEHKNLKTNLQDRKEKCSILQGTILLSKSEDTPDINSKTFIEETFCDFM